MSRNTLQKWENHEIKLFYPLHSHVFIPVWLKIGKLSETTESNSQDHNQG